MVPSLYKTSFLKITFWKWWERFSPSQGLLRTAVTQNSINPSTLKAGAFQLALRSFSIGLPVSGIHNGFPCTKKQVFRLQTMQKRLWHKKRNNMICRLHPCVYFGALGWLSLHFQIQNGREVHKSQEQEQQVQDLKKQMGVSESLIPESAMKRGLKTCSWAATKYTFFPRGLKALGGLGDVLGGNWPVRFLL